MAIESSLWPMTLVHGVEVALPDLIGIGVTVVTGGNGLAGLAAATGVKLAMQAVPDDLSTKVETVNTIGTPMVVELLTAMTHLAPAAPLIGVIVEGGLGWPLRVESASSPEPQAELSLDQELRALLRPEPTVSPSGSGTGPELPSPVVPPPTVAP